MTRTNRRRFLVLFAAIAALLALFGALALPATAQAQSAKVLVSNMEQTDRGAGTIVDDTYLAAQSFSVPSGGGNYTLTSIEILLDGDISSTNISSLTVSVWSADSSGHPDSSLHTLTNPASITEDVAASFTAPAGATLAAGNTYVVVADYNRASSEAWQATNSDNEDATSVTGWTIANTGLWRTRSGTSWGGRSYALFLRVNGTAAGEAPTPSTDATLSGLTVTAGGTDLVTFASDTTDYTASVANDVAEVTVTAETTDSGASIDYLDASDMTLVDADGSSTGQQVTLAEGDNVIKVKVTAADGSATQTYTVTVNRAACTLNTGDLWCGVVTVEEVKDSGTTIGYGFLGTGALSDTEFSVGTNDYAIDAAWTGLNTFAGQLFFGLSRGNLTTADKAKLVLQVDGHSDPFAFSDAEGPTPNGTYNWASTSLDWSSTSEVTLRLRGAAAANVAPSFTSAETFGVDENGTTVGTVEASDDDTDDDITGYALTGGADQALFAITINGTSGALTFQAAPDYEDPQDANTDNAYEVTVQATSGTGDRVQTAIQTITVTVTNVNEQPAKPAKPTVTAVSGATDSLAVTWSEPDLNGGPAITGYGVEYRVGATGTWTDWSHSGTDATTTITGLTADTDYQVQVRALNGETPSDWSDPSDAVRTNAEMTPVVTIAKDKNVVLEEAGAADFTLSRTGSTTAALTVTVEVTQETDRDILPDGAAAERTVTFAVGSAATTLSVALDNDDLADTFGELTVEVQAGAGYTVGDPASATVSVGDTDTGRPTPANLMASPGAGAGEVVLSWDAHAPYLTFTRHEYRYKTDGNYPAAWTDIPNSGQWDTNAGDGSNLTGYTVTGLVGGQVHSFQVRASSSNSGAASNEAMATPRSAVVSFGAESYSVDEGGAVDVTVQLDAATGREVVVPVSAAGAGGATPPGETGADWSGVPENVTFGATDTAMTFTLTATQDTDADAGESVALSFGTLPDGVTAGSPSEATVTITDDDTTTPTIDSVEVTSTPVLESDTYGAGETIQFTVTFDEAVDVTGDPVFTFSLGNSGVGNIRNVDAAYESGSGTVDLVFGYTVVSTDMDDNGIYQLGGSDFASRDGPVDLDSDDSITLTGTSTDASLAYATRVQRSDHKVNGSLSIVQVAVSSTPVLESDTYGAGETIEFTVTFTAAVDVTGDPVFRFALGNSGAAVDKDAAYESGSGTTALVFGYTVQAGDMDSNGIYLYDGTDLNNPDGPVRLDSNDSIQFTGTSTDVPLEWPSGRAGQSGHKVDGSQTPAATTCTLNTGDIWCGVVTVALYTAGGLDLGYGFVDAATDIGALSDTGFSVGTNSYTIDDVWTGVGSLAGALNFGLTSILTAADQAKLVLHVDSTSFAFSAATGPDSSQAYRWLTSGLDWSSTSSVTLRLRALPDAPTAFTAKVGDTQVALAWKAAALDSGVTGHEYRYKTDGDYPLAWTAIANSGPGEANEGGFMVTGLTNEVAHTFELRAVNAAGEGDAATAGPVTPTPGICGRTQKIQEVILAELSGVDDCAAVTVANLASITTLGAFGSGTVNQGITSLQKGDFAGLTSLTILNLSQNTLTSLPEGIFAGLAELTELDLSLTQLESLPEGAFDGLVKLEVINLARNTLTGLRAGEFSGLTALAVLTLTTNDLSELPEEVFSDLTALEDLYLADNDLSSLPDVVFSGLTSLRRLYLNTNDLSSLPDVVFSGLTSLQILRLYDNNLSELPGTVFSGPTALTQLFLDGNDLSELPGTVFSSLTALQKLTLHNNALDSLPAGLFSGLTALTQLTLEGNSTNPMELTVTVEKVGTNQVRAKVLAGAPFAVAIPVTLVNGTLTGSVTELSVAAGSVEGTAVTMTRTDGTTAAATVDVDLTTPPTLPTGHLGYIFKKATTNLPATILPDSTNAAPAFTSSTTFNPAENQTAVGTVMASDDDMDDDITGYALNGGADEALFSINDSGVLTFQAAPNYEDPQDANTDNAYVVVVQATSGTGARVKTADQTITVTVMNTNEQTDTPAKPTVTAVEGSATSLTATWVKPGLNGGPDITGYNVNYRVSTVTAWETVTHSGAGVTSTITGLTESTSYQVRVQALNGETDSDWSDPSEAVSTNSETTTTTCTLNTGDLWCGVVTVGTYSGGVGFLDSDGALTDNNGDQTITIGSDSYTVASVVILASPAGSLVMELDTRFPTSDEATLEFHIDGSPFKVSEATFDVGGGYYWQNSGLSWSVGDMVDVRLRRATAPTITAPTIASVAVTSTPLLTSSGGSTPDTYGAGETIEISVTFDEAVTATAATDFVLSVGGRKRAPLLRGSGTETLVFGYTVQAEDSDTDGIWIGDQTRTLVGNRNGDPQTGAITSVADVAADLTHSQLGTQSGHKVDGSRNVDDPVEPIPPGLEVTLQLSDDAVLENATPVTVTATVSPASPVAFTVTISATPVAPATADDFTLSQNRVLSFAANATESTGTVTIRTVDDDIPEPADVVRVSGAVSNAAIPDPDDVTLTIFNDDPEEFDIAVSAPAAVDEDAGAAVVTVTLTTRKNTAPVTDIGMFYRVERGGTATRGADYTPPPGDAGGSDVHYATVQPTAFSPNASGTAWVAAPSFTIGIIDDQEAERAETIVFAVLTYDDQSPAHTITIRDNDGIGPGPPTALGAEGKSQTQIRLAWTAPAAVGSFGITGYRIEVSENAGASWHVLVANTGSAEPNKFHNGLSAGDTRHYRVSAINPAGTSAGSGVASATTVAAGPAATNSALPPPQDVNAVPLLPGEIRLSWWRNPNDASHDLVDRHQYRYRVRNASTWTVDWTTVNQTQTMPPPGTAEIRNYNKVLLSGLTAVTTYEFQVRSMDTDGGTSAAVSAMGTAVDRQMVWIEATTRSVEEGAPLRFAVWRDQPHGRLRVILRISETGDMLPPEGRGRTGYWHEQVYFGDGNKTIPLVLDTVNDHGGPEDPSVVTIEVMPYPLYPDNPDHEDLYAVYEVYPELGAATATVTAAESSSQGGAGPPLTAAFEGLPEAHDGESAFSFRLAFSEAVAVTPEAMRTRVLTVAGGAVTGAARVDGASGVWAITVTPDTREALSISLAPAADCAADGAVCTADGRALSIGAAHIVGGPGPDTGPAPLTATFPESVYASAQHKGPSDRPQVVVAFSAPVAAFGADTPSVSATGASVDGVQRLDKEGLEHAYVFFLTPEDHKAIVFRLHANRACTDGGICTADRQQLSNSPSVTVAGPADEPERNTAATGTPTISGTVQVGETLTADTSGIADEDGLDNAAFTYQWLADDADISGATGSTYALTDSNEGKAIRVRVSFTDDEGNDETLTSGATDAVAAAPPPNNPATGAPTISGKVQVGETLTADTSGVADEDGLDNVAFTYQWLADNAAIAGATGSTYILADADEGKAIKVRVSFIDDAGNEETLTSAATAAVSAAPPPPPDNVRAVTQKSGAVKLNWDAPDDATVTGYRIERRPADEDRRDNHTLVEDTGGTETGYIDQSTEKGVEYEYRVSARNEDGAGEASGWVSAAPEEESVASEDVVAWSAIMTVEWVYQGYGYYSTDAKKAGSLSPASFEVDGTTYTSKMVETQGWWLYIGVDRELPFDFVLELDGVRFASNDASFRSYSYGNIYRWEGTGLSLRDGDTVEVRLLRAFEDETAVDSAATGAPIISGTVQVGETLTADTSGIADADGLDDVAFTYRWLADNAAIAGATGSTYTLADADEGKAITVQVTFTDDGGNDETLTSAATDAVEAAPASNTPATGTPTISGTAQVGETLTADTSDISDADGLTNATFNYQWLADDADIAGATGSTYALVEADEGKTVKVQVTFTDDGGNDETLTSGATDAVAAPEPPAKPTGLSATPSHDRVVLTWDDPNDDTITGYVILRRNRETDAQGQFTELAPDTGTAATTYTDDTVAAETPYTYRIKAINAHGTSERSRWFHIDTLAGPEPTQEPTPEPESVSEGDADLPNDNSTPGRVAVGGSATGAIGDRRRSGPVRGGAGGWAHLPVRPDGQPGRGREGRFRTPFSGRSTTARDSTRRTAATTTSTAVGTAEWTFTATESGTYYARVSGDRDEVGSYTLSVTDVTPQ